MSPHSVRQHPSPPRRFGLFHLAIALFIALLLALLLAGLLPPRTASAAPLVAAIAWPTSGGAPA